MDVALPLSEQPRNWAAADKIPLHYSSVECRRAARVKYSVPFMEVTAIITANPIFSAAGAPKQHPAGGQSGRCPLYRTNIPDQVLSTEREAC